MRKVILCGVIVLASLLPLTGLAQDKGTSTAELERRLEAQARRLERLERRQYQKGPNTWQKVHLSGFLNTGFQSTNLGGSGPTYRNTDHEVRASNFTSAGVQIEGRVTPRLSGTVQLLALGTDNFDVETEWAYLSYDLSPSLEFRAGRLILPFYMYSQSLYLGYAHPWVEPPPEVYDTAPLRSFEGADLTWQFSSGPMAHSLNVYFGSTTVDSELTASSSPSIPFTVDKPNGPFTVHNLHGLNLSSTLGNLNTWLAYSSGDTDLDLTGVGLPSYSMRNDSAYFASAGLEYDNGNVLFIAEAVNLDIESDWFPKSRAQYATVGYHFGSWMPHLTWANSETTNFDEIEGDATGEFLYNRVKTHQKSWTLGLRKDVAPGFAVKAEVSTYYDIGGAEDGNDHPDRGDLDSGLFSSLPTSEDDPLVFRVSANLAF